jgi:hypothetical protein
MAIQLPWHLTPIVLEQLPTVRLPGGCIYKFDYARSTFFDCYIGLFDTETMGGSVTEFGLDPAIGNSCRIRYEHQYNRNRAKLTQDRLEKRLTKGLLQRLLWCTSAGLAW